MSNYKMKALPKQITNLAQIYQIIGYIDNSLSSKLKAETSLKAGLNNKFEQIELPEIMQSFFSDKISWFDLANLRKQLDEIAKTAPVVTITLSDIPNAEFKMKVTSWFRSINPFILVEIMVDELIIGGCIIKTERREIDLSIRKSLKSFTGNLLETIDNV
ncbi:MAG: hypothetical protein WCI37_02555 [bacterium]|jgi:F0F1-type ATP synthase delta subunit